MKKSESYHRILRSTSLMAGSSVINIVMRIARTKFLAIYLGPSGIGLLGLFNSISDVIGTIAGVGLDSSGVRRIAEVSASERRDDDAIGRTIWTVRKVALIFGVGGMIATFALSPLICRLTFEDIGYTPDIMLLSVVVLLGTLTTGEVVLIHGMRRIGELAKLNIFSALFGTILSVPIIYLWGQNGIVPVIVGASIAGLLATRWYSGHISVSRVRMSWRDIQAELRPLLKLGTAVMASMLMTRGTMYLVNVLIARRLSLEAAGLYQAAVILSSVYVGFVLNSMVKDYLPRLTAIANDHTACNKLVNEQVEVGILLSVPGILATLTFAPILIQVLYTDAFASAFEVLRWQILGIALQVVSWPVFFVLEAKGRGELYLLANLLPSVVYVGLLWPGISYFGLKGTGIAFFGMWVFFGILTYTMARQLTGFRWSSTNIRIALLTLPSVAIVFVAGLVLDQFWSTIVGGVVSAAIALYSMKCLGSVVKPGWLAVVLPFKTKAL